MSEKSTEGRMGLHRRERRRPTLVVFVLLLIATFMVAAYMAFGDPDWLESPDAPAPATSTILQVPQEY